MKAHSDWREEREESVLKPSKTRQVALSGLLFALAMALSFMESAIAPLLGLMPGVKIGLANIVVMYALFFMGFPQALSLAVLKALFVLLTRGAVAGLLSLCGGLLSLLVMWLLYKLPKRPTYFILSVCGSLAHNVGQMIAASFVLGSRLALTYAPVLIVSGLGMGWVTSASLAAILPALGRMGFNTKK
ncbi:Gx transporter family protein [Allofournierella sp.]|uniref:Gx transporter family protein n=1 Tax=Allofournierella sp. TaxID=1940256 RepID=UPI0015AAC2E4